MPKLEKGAFIIKKNINNTNNVIGYHNEILNSVIVEDKPISNDIVQEHIPTIVIIRKEYVNLYHTIIELFITYITIELTIKTNFNILFLDSHPEGSLDILWKDILKPNSIVRIDNYTKNILFNNLIFVPCSYNNPLFKNNILKYTKYPNLLDDFIQKILNYYKINRIKNERIKNERKTLTL